MLKVIAALLLLPLLVLSQNDKSVKQGQKSPDKRCSAPGAGSCVGFKKLSPTHRTGTSSKTQYHTKDEPDFFAKVGTVKMGSVADSDPWKVGRFTLDEQKIVVMPNTFPFGYHKGIKLQTIRLVAGADKTHRGYAQKAYDLEVVLVGRNLDQSDEFAENAYIAFSRIFQRKADNDKYIDPANAQFLSMTNGGRDTPYDIDLTAIFPKGELIKTYAGSSAEGCSCDTDTTWVMFTSSGHPESYVSDSLMNQVDALGVNKNAWRDYNEAETSELVITVHSFLLSCDKIFDEDCNSICDCDKGTSTVIEIPKDDDKGDDGKGDGEGDGEDDECKKQPTPAHCMSSAGTVEVCLAVTFLAAVPFF